VAVAAEDMLTLAGGGSNGGWVRPSAAADRALVMLRGCGGELRGCSTRCTLVAMHLPCKISIDDGGDGAGATAMTAEAVPGRPAAPGRPRRRRRVACRARCAR